MARGKSDSDKMIAEDSFYGPAQDVTAVGHRTDVSADYQFGASRAPTQIFDETGLLNTMLNDRKKISL